jgi:hypothetical protein
VAPGDVSVREDAVLGTDLRGALNLLASWTATPDQLQGERTAADDARRS